MTFRLRPTALSLCLAWIAFSAPLPAQQEGTIEHARKLLEEVHADFLKKIEGVNDAQWNFRVGTSPHTIGEEAEHIALAEQDLQRVLIKALEKEANPEKAKELVGKHKQVRDALMDREKPAEHFKPPNTLRSKAEVLEYINTAHRKLMAIAEAKRQFDVHIYKHPSKNIGELNGVQWFYYIVYHKMRHMKQIDFVMAQPDFPGQIKKTD